jgi:hypothetical protein
LAGVAVEQQLIVHERHRDVGVNTVFGKLVSGKGARGKIRGVDVDAGNVTVRSECVKRH